MHDDNDPFVYDGEQLRAIADERAVRDGLIDFQHDRVMAVTRDEEGLVGSVEGANPDQPHATRLRYDADGALRVDCDCRAGGEAEAGRACRHAVALLYRYTALQTGADDPMIGAQESALEERTRRGRIEVRVEHLHGEPWFGRWRAASLVSSTHHDRSYEVRIRSLTGVGNHCTCPDFATNRLGTCKHIEAVLHQLSKRPDWHRLRTRKAPHPYVYLAWDRDPAPAIRLQDGLAVAPDLEPILARYFDPDGGFRGRLPEDWFRFAEQVRGRDDIDLGEDAEGFAARVAEDAAQARRAETIGRDIRASGGHLEGVRARLYPYQVEGVAFLAANGRGLLADDMGLGKTLQAIAAAHWLRLNSGVKRVLVVCPASLKHQWAREIQRFTEAHVQVLEGNAEARMVQYRQPADLYIANYELVLRDLTPINTHLAPDLLILDEAQRIKNWRTKIASTIKLIPSRYAFVLTGTPLENRLEDLYSLMQVVDPRVLGPLWRYLIDFHVTNERGKVLGYRNLSELRRRIAPVMLRRDRALVRDQLPDRIEQRLDVPLSARQRELHDGALSNAGRLARIARRRALTPSEKNRLMAALQQARMACDAAGLVDKETEGSPKLDELAGLLEDLCLGEGLKVVIFSQWERMTALVEPLLHRLGIGHVRLHGGVPTAKRGDLLDRFREDRATQVFLSTDAGGVGLNLQAATVLINLDVPWNPAVLDQRIARVHRLGQTGKVQILLLVAADAYEERVMELVRSKRDLFDNVVDPEATEDVVGVSSRLLETLVEDLAPPRPATGEAAAETLEAVGDEETEDASAAPQEAAAETPPAAGDRRDERWKAQTEGRLREAIEAIQTAFGPRLERILGAGGGLLAVVEQVDAEAERRARTLSDPIPVAVVDARTLGSLQRLGVVSAADAVEVLYAADASGARTSPLMARAKDTLEAAEVLLGQDRTNAAAELLASAFLTAVAARADLPRPPAEEQVGVWLYAEALPKGWLDAEQAAALMRALAVAKAPTVPPNLAAALALDVQQFVRSVGMELGDG